MQLKYRNFKCAPKVERSVPFCCAATDPVMEASKLKVEELRAQLSQRGLSTAGIKSTLVRKLEAALLEEGKKSTDSNGCSRVGQKRQRGSEAEDSVAKLPRRIKAIEEFQSMSLKQLREEAEIRGVSVAGTKKQVVERLCADNDTVSKDNDQGELLEATEEHKDGNEDSHSLTMTKALNFLQALTVKQLREEAVTRGISAAGTKKQLLERLFAEIENVTSSNDPVKYEKVETVVKATMKGSAVLDKWLQDDIKAHYHVLQIGDEIYDAMLNQTNIGENNNKFFVIQALESDDGRRFMVYYRWGRVGVKGQDKLNGPYSCKLLAIREYEKKFYAKTRNHWADRREFVSHPKSYTWLEMDYSEMKNEMVVEEKHDHTMKAEPRESKLDPCIAKFISLICNVSMMQQQMMEIGYNAEKLPLGKLSKSTILKGYNVLKRIADVIGKANRNTLEQLSGEFYSVIPHDFGFRRTSLFIIDNPIKLKSKLEMVEALGEIEVAMKLIDGDGDMEDPLYSHYRRLNCELLPLDGHSEEFSMIEKYTKNTHAKTHSGYEVDVIQILKLSREGEAERFEKFSRAKNRMLLWHGSRLTNWIGILSQGLRIAPPEAPVNGYMFGKGVYFADMFSKSANYCSATGAAPEGVLVLCEVALGDMAELLSANYNADKLPPGKLSTKGVGHTAPDLSESLTLEDGLVVPLGLPKVQPIPKCSLQYNEYIVYNVEQIRMRYLVQVKFNFR